MQLEQAGFQRIPFAGHCGSSRSCIIGHIRKCTAQTDQRSKCGASGLGRQVLRLHQRAESITGVGQAQPQFRQRFCQLLRLGGSALSFGIEALVVGLQSTRKSIQAAAELDQAVCRVQTQVLQVHERQTVQRLAQLVGLQNAVTQTGQQVGGLLARQGLDVGLGQQISDCAAQIGSIQRLQGGLRQVGSEVFQRSLGVRALGAEALVHRTGVVAAHAGLAKRGAGRQRAASQDAAFAISGRLQACLESDQRGSRPRLSEQVIDVGDGRFDGLGHRRGFNLPSRRPPHKRDASIAAGLVFDTGHAVAILATCPGFASFQALGN